VVENRAHLWAQLIENNLISSYERKLQMENNIITIKGIECYEKDGTAYLKLETVARGLGFTQIAASGNEAVRWERVRKYLTELGVPTSGDGNGCPDFIPENIFYRLAMKAKNEAAEAFQAKIADEVIPSIRKHGAYMTPETIEKVLLNPDTIIRLATDLKAEREQRLLLEEKTAAQEKVIESQKPMVEFAEKVGNSKDLITMSQMAKLVHDENIPLGRNKLLRWLRDKKILRENNEPYQQYVSSGLFDVKEVAKETTYGHKIFPVTLVTGKGQMYIVEKLRKEYAAG